MEFQILNIDALCMILKHFVAIDDEGPLTLIMVCTLWRDLVISSPRFWTWITIDDNIAELDDRIQIFDALSAGYPLQLTIRLPIQDVDRFQSLFGRCSALFIDQCGQPDPSEIEKDVQGICNILKTPEARSIKRIYWYNRDIPSIFSPLPLQEQLFKAGELELEPVFDIFPATIISAIELKPNISLVRSRRLLYLKLCKTLSNFPHLTTLHLSSDRLTGLLEEDMSHIQLPLLHSLSLTIAPPYSGLTWSILQYIIAPSVHSVCLGGALSDGYIFIGASKLGESMRPKKLTLEIVGKPDFSAYRMQKMNYNLASVEYLTISLQAPGEDLGAQFPWSEDLRAQFPWWEDLGAQWWEELHFLLAAMPYLALLDLRFGGDLACFQDIIGPISCDLHVYWKPSRSMRISNRNTANKTSPLIGPLAQPGRRVERMTVLIGRYELQRIFTQLNIPVTSLKTLILRVDEVADRGFKGMLRSTRPGWLESLQELDIRGVEFSNSYKSSDTGGSLPNLMILKCSTHVAIRLIGYTPQLRKLTIVDFDPLISRKDWWSFKYRITLVITRVIDERPPLSSIALEFFPPWEIFLKMLTMYSRPRKTQPESILRSVELPALPHPSILRPLVSALRGEQIAAKNIPSISVSSQEDEGCNFCHQSGWKCVYLTHDHYCNRHSPHNLVTITAHTLEGIGGQVRTGEGNCN